MDNEAAREIIKLIGARCPTLKHPTLGDIPKIVLGLDSYDTLDYWDLMEESAIEMFPVWHAYKVRQNQNQITKSIKRDGIVKVCECCGSTDNVEIHHIIPPNLRDGYYGGNDNDNIQFLCHNCHKRTMNNKYCNSIFEQLEHEGA